ncbi:MAG: hypothetical protein ABH950_03200 [Candidatus Altiarchaeota archaeon]
MGDVGGSLEVSWKRPPHRVQKELPDLMPENPHRIRGTVPAAAKLDGDFPVNQSLLSKAVSDGVIEETPSGQFRIPMRNPHVTLDMNIHKRSVHTTTTPARVFKGVGGDEGGKVAFKYMQGSFMSFFGGVRKETAGYEMETALKLRELWQTRGSSDPAIQLVREYGVTKDVFINPVAVFKPQWIPVKTRGRSLNAIKLVRQREGMRIARVPPSLGEQQRVFFYETLVPERQNELEPFKDKGNVWKRIQDVVDNLKGIEIEKKMPENLKIAIRAAAGYATLNHLVHHVMDGACQNNEGGVFSPLNVNPLSVFDYATIWTPTNEPILATISETYQEKDNKDAKKMLELLSIMLGLSLREKQKALRVYDAVYNSGKEK